MCIRSDGSRRGGGRRGRRRGGGGRGRAGGRPSARWSAVWRAGWRARPPARPSIRPRKRNTGGRTTRPGLRRLGRRFRHVSPGLWLRRPERHAARRSHLRRRGNPAPERLEPVAARFDARLERGASRRPRRLHACLLVHGLANGHARHSDPIKPESMTSGRRVHRERQASCAASPGLATRRLYVSVVYWTSSTGRVEGGTVLRSAGLPTPGLRDRRMRDRPKSRFRDIPRRAWHSSGPLHGVVGAGAVSR